MLIPDAGKEDSLCCTANANSHEEIRNAAQWRAVIVSNFKNDVACMVLMMSAKKQSAEK